MYLTLRGKYGVRSSPAVVGDADSDTIMYIGAPIRSGNTIIGSLTVAKPNRTVLPFIERAQNKIIRWGALLFCIIDCHRRPIYLAIYKKNQSATRIRGARDEG